MSDAFENCLKLRKEQESKLPYKRNEILEIPDNAERLQSQKIEKLLGKDTNNSEEKTHEIKKKEKKKPETYCGFKKGFLTASSDKNGTKSKPTKKKDEEITVISKKDETDKNILPEVQTVMNQQMPFLKSNDWVTEDLLSKISANPKLFKRFTDPRFAEVLQQFQSNPQQIMRMCEGNPEMKEFIQDFCSIMGDHFTELGQKQDEQRIDDPPKTKTKSADREKCERSDDEKKMKDILSDPEIASILKDTETQRLLRALKEEPVKAQKLLKTADAAFRRKIQKLIDVGLLQMAM